MTLPTGLTRAVAKYLDDLVIEVKIACESCISVVQTVSQVFRSAGCPKYFGPKIAVRKSLALTLRMTSACLCVLNAILILISQLIRSHLLR